jgi:hypothetical protein
LKPTLFLKKSRIAGATNRSVRHRRVPLEIQQKIGLSYDSSDFYMTPSLERRESELPALSRSCAALEGSFTDGSGLSSLVIQDLRVLDEGLDVKQTSSKIQMLPDSDQGFARLKKIYRLQRENSSTSFSSASTRASSSTSSRLGSPSYALQNSVINSQKRSPDALRTSTSTARLLSKSGTYFPKSELKGVCGMQDQWAAVREEEDVSSANALSGGSDAYMHNSSIHSGGVRSQVLIPLQSDRVAGAGVKNSFFNSLRSNYILMKLLLLASSSL